VWSSAVLRANLNALRLRLRLLSESGRRYTVAPLGSHELGIDGLGQDEKRQ